MSYNFDLCILIPSFDNFNGVKRIVDIFDSCPNVSIIVSDDSSKSEVAQTISDFISSKNTARIKYIKRVGLPGAVHNWNYLLTLVNAKFYTLVHHDEYHSDTFFVDDIQRYFYQDKACIILPFKVVNKNGVGRRVSSNLQRRANRFLRFFLPVYNIIGPTSSLVISQDIRPEFDTKLTWLVDTEWYSRVLRLSESTNFLRMSSSITSVFYENSITWSSNGAVKRLMGKELSYLQNQYVRQVTAWRFYGFIYCRIVIRLLGFSDYISFYLRRLVSNFQR